MILTTFEVPTSVPEPIRKYLGLLSGESQDLHCAWGIFKDISVDAHDNIALINKTSPKFFRRLQGVFFEHLIIGVARFTDHQMQGKNRNLSLVELFEGGKIPQLDSLERKSKNIREIRNKIVAHLDLDCGLDPSLLPNKGTIREIRESIELIEEIIEMAWQKWAGGSSPTFVPETIEILNCLKKAEVYDRLEAKGFVPENYWNYPDDLIQNFLGSSPKARKDC
jgi:hypothetical protein